MCSLYGDRPLTLTRNEKFSIQGDIGGAKGWMNFDDTKDNTLTHDQAKLVHAVPPVVTLCGR